MLISEDLTQRSAVSIAGFEAQPASSITEASRRAIFFMANP
jgi:hypothetical protein